MARSGFPSEGYTVFLHLFLIRLSTNSTQTDGIHVDEGLSQLSAPRGLGMCRQCTSSL
ncbi:hypothetical protein FE257_003412 [Aspergillus nanangensis]|uniref:Uncharacterized protein n=1 Tax=Aspergillus nanangensis TaxID=2582783 RepID=A0AAD4GPM2_ASPNN|nr:hypothetical protein FE257_003412 [Aspergillus nanangensis]